MVIDCDLHVIEPPGLWSELNLEGDGWSGLRFKGRPSLVPPEYLSEPDSYSYTKGIMRRYRDGFENSWNAASTLRAMDRMKVVRALLMPTRGLFVTTIGDEYGFLRRSCQIYNEWIEDYASLDRDRLFTAHLWDGISEVSENANAIVIRPQQLQFIREFPHVPLVLHEGTTPTDPCIGFGRTTNRLEAHCISHVFEAMCATMKLTVGGILHNNPHLKVLICEAGSWWINEWLSHLNREASDVNGYGHYRYPYLPADYASRLFVTATPGSVDEHCVFGSDYPHGDSSYPYFGFYNEALKFMTENANRFLHDLT